METNSNKEVTLKVNNISVTVPSGTRICDAAEKAGFHVPTLCYLKGVCNDGSCRICVVEVKGARNLVTSCFSKVREGMEVFTSTPKVIAHRKMTVELLMSDHNKDCLSCVRSGDCELQKLSYYYNCDSNAFEGEKNVHTIDANDYLVRDNSKCILCRRCVGMCSRVQEIGVIGENNRGFKTEIGCAFEKPLENTPCVACGQCINVCPVGALSEKDDTHRVFDAIRDPNKHVVVGVAPAVRVALGEEFGMPIGTDVEGKMVSALKLLGFDKVFDVDMTADLTIMEEGHELLARLNDKNATLPMMTSCSPGWIRYVEFYYPELIPHLSSCKSPQQMFGAVIKTYYAQKFGIDPKDIVVVTAMPCIAKKTEVKRDHQNAAGVADVDISITTRELARMIKISAINFDKLADGEWDNPIGEGSTAGLLFGVTGGVTEAAIRTLHEVVNGKPLPNKLDFTPVRGMEGIKEATVELGGKKVKIAVAHGLSNAKKIMEQIKAGKADYHFVEVMTCPGGCINGGGQPIVMSEIQNSVDVKALRAKAMYDKDLKAELRKSHDNPVINALYSEYFEKPLSHKSHEILHTKYKKRDQYK